MKKFLIAAATASLLLAACSDDSTTKKVDEATPITAEVESALTNTQTTLSAELASMLGLSEEDLTVSVTANTEQEPPAAIATVILLTNPDVAEDKINEAVTYIQQQLETVDGVSVHENNIMITNLDGDVLH